MPIGRYPQSNIRAIILTPMEKVIRETPDGEQIEAFVSIDEAAGRAIIYHHIDGKPQVIGSLAIPPEKSRKIT